MSSLPKKYLIRSTTSSGVSLRRFTLSWPARWLPDFSLVPLRSFGQYQRTHGWAAGLRLAALVFDGLGEHALLSEHLTGDVELVAEYFMEAFANLPGPLREFLVQTSVLDELTPDACRAVREIRCPAISSRNWRGDTASLFRWTSKSERIGTSRCGWEAEVSP